MTVPLRIAILAHSTNPRGGVVHALELGDALTRLGHDAVVHAPDAEGHGFFRPTRCRTVTVPVSRLSRSISARRQSLSSGAERSGDPGSGIEAARCFQGSPIAADAASEMTEQGGSASAAAACDTFGLVEARVADYLRYFEDPSTRDFDVFHAQDGISGNALATLKDRGLIDGFVRTVHHLDTFADPRVDALQRRSIVEAKAHVVVSRLWRDRLGSGFGIEAAVVGNGVDLRRFSPRPEPKDLILRQDLGLLSGPVFLSVGGIEERKNTLRLLEAFAQVFAVRPSAQLVIAGGASLLDHDACQARFAEALAASGLPAHALRRIGTVADPDMPALYRNADALIFPSLKEGFGLVVLEAMASGLPVVTSSIEPFTGYLGDNDVIWCTPDNVASIADAMMLALHPALKTGLATRGPVVAARHDWLDVARAHLPVYDKVGALSHA